jgi:catechol 2,3-dioxygenase-like lactoylglutathione lyase family enzyme
MALGLAALCVDATDPSRMARFWADALGWEVGGETDGRVSLVPTDVTRFRMDFLPLPTPKLRANRHHLDLQTTSLEDQRDTAARLVELGGRHIDVGQKPDEGHIVLADPEGNELCLIEPGNRFLASCPRMGAISCDGTRAVGYFWSAALDWPLVWDQDEETAIQAPDGTGPKITWGGPPIPPKLAKNRFHLEVAPVDGSEQLAEVERLVTLGATRIGSGPGVGDGAVVLTDPDGNELSVAPASRPQPVRLPSPH